MDLKILCLILETVLPKRLKLKEKAYERQNFEKIKLAFCEISKYDSKRSL